MIRGARIKVIEIGALLPALLAVPALAQDSRCGAGKDLVIQALERITPQSGDDAFEDALQLLKHAVSECSELGDAWYYRSLVEKRLGHDALAKYAMNKARFNNSEALQEGLNPLVLSTPSARGISTEPELPSTPHLTPAQVHPGPIHDKWALVIGISQFTDSTVPPLRFTTADAISIASALKDPAIGRFPPANVHTLINSQATTKNIKEELNWIARHAAPNDLVVIYVATHGTPRTLDSAGGATYLVTYDTEISSAGKFDEDTLYATAYPMVDLANAVSTRMKSLRTAVILDTCYSAGSITADASVTTLASASPSDKMLARITQGTGRIVLAASRASEQSLESPELKHGYFTYYLLQALQNSQGRSPITQLFASVEGRVSAQVNQHPVMSRSSSDADFAIGAPPTESASSFPPVSSPR